MAQLLPENLNCTFFTSTGTEAVEGALKLARKYTSRYKIMACRHAYHGSTAGAESLRSDHMYTAASRPLVPGAGHISYNAFEDIERIHEDVAAVIIEPIQGEAGVITPAKGYLHALRRRCDQTGTLLIFDEIQTGMGRTGTLWAFEYENVIPDILLLGKAFGGGLPLGAFIASQEIMAVLSHDPVLGHLTTFGGHPLSCATSLEALRIIQEEALHRRASSHHQIIMDKLQHHPAFREIRGRGLLLALDLKNPDHLKPAIAAMKKNGLLADWFLFNNRSIRLAPPLVISDTEVKVLCEKLAESLDDF
jgi:acetylornithine/succinyldiaminopimelate/putrescine aminotransferase